MTFLTRLWRKEEPPPPATTVLRGVAYHVDELAPIEQIPALAADAKLLTAFRESGHGSYAHSSRSLAEQALSSAQKTLAAAALTAEDIDAIVMGTSEIREPQRFPEMLSTELLSSLGLCDVPVVGVTLAGCANWSSSLRVARNMLVAEELDHVLLIEADQVRGTMQRQLYDDGVAALIFGDGAASLVVSADDDSERGASDFELVSMAQTIRPLDWSKVDINTIAANNVIGFQSVFDAALEHAGVERADFAKIFLSNISLTVVEDLAMLLDLDMATVHTANTKRTAHVWSCDNLINLTDYCASAPVPAGALFAMVCQAESYFSTVVCRKR